jgi:hypothetical protein
LAKDSSFRSTYNDQIGASAEKTLKSDIIKKVLRQGRKDNPSDRLFKEMGW